MVLRPFCFDRKFCTALIYGAIFFLVFFWTVPVGFISSLIALQNLAKVVPFLEPGEAILYTVLANFIISHGHENFILHGMPIILQISQTMVPLNKLNGT